jgi:hypothetical protein
VIKIESSSDSRHLDKIKALLSCVISKLGTWIGGILAALVVLVVAVVMIFPVLIQGPLEAQLSELSDLDVKISKPNIFLISNAFKNSNISEFGSAAKV